MVRHGRDSVRRATTLVEVVTACAVMGIVASGAVFAFRSLRATAHCAAVGEHLKHIFSGIELYYNKYHVYPSGAYPLKESIAEFVTNEKLWADPADRTYKDVISTTYMSPTTTEVSARVLGAPCGDLKYIAIYSTGKLKTVDIQVACPETSAGTPSGGASTAGGRVTADWSSVDFAFYGSGTEVKLTGNLTIDGKILERGNLTCTGNSTVNGPVIVSGTITDKNDKLHATSEASGQNVPEIVVDPTPIEFLTNKQEFTATSPPGDLLGGGVYVFKNGLSVASDTQLSGTVVVYGDCTISGKVSGNFNLIVLGGGKLIMSGQATINGFVYASGGCKLSGETTIRGTVIAQGTSTMGTGQTSVSYDLGVLNANPPPVRVYFTQ